MSRRLGLPLAGLAVWRAGSQVGARRPALMRLLSVLALVLGLTGALTAAPAGATQPRKALVPWLAPSRAPAHVPLQPGLPAGRWGPGIPGPGAWLPTGEPAAATPAASGILWRVEQPTSAVGPNGALNAVSCAGPAACTGMGFYTNSADTFVPLAEAWNGTSWRIQATPNPAGATFAMMLGVSCSSARACTGVGIYTNSANAFLPVAERWNGTAWRVQAIPLPAGARNADLTGVSCTSASICFAVGGYTVSTGRAFELAERWNGTRWAIQAIPNPPGSAFKGLSGVSCTSARACSAVGNYVNGGPLLTLAERWNGTRWGIQATPNPPRRNAALAGVSCTSADACTATGYSISSAQIVFPLAEAWTGTRWHIQPTPTPAGFAFFAPLPGVSCTSANACTAAGSWDNTAGNEFTLAERWNGIRWAIQATPNPAPPPSASALEGVSCTAARACTAVGTFGPPGFPGRTLAERWNGTRWAIQPTPNP